MLVYLRDRTAQTVVCAATLRQKLQIKLAILPNHSILTPGQPVPGLTLYRQALDRITTGVPIFESVVLLNPEKNSHGKSGNRTQVYRSRGGYLNQLANKTNADNDNNNKW